VRGMGVKVLARTRDGWETRSDDLADPDRFIGVMKERLSILLATYSSRTATIKVKRIFGNLPPFWRVHVAWLAAQNCPAVVVDRAERTWVLVGVSRKWTGKSVRKGHYVIKYVRVTEQPRDRPDPGGA